MGSGRLDAFEPPKPTGRRAEVLGRLAASMAALAPGRRIVVAIDGVDGAGKTVLARELVELIRPTRPVARVSLDGFHRPSADRYARGRTAATFYEDSYNLEAVVGRLVRPFRDGLAHAVTVFDVEADRPDVRFGAPPERNALLLVDGIFLHRPELVDLWDASVWVDVPFEVAVPRGNARFDRVGREDADPDAPGNARYVGGQRLYLAACAPRRRATWVLDNRDLAQPRLTAPHRRLA
ncbi:MAG: nucleoside/nucleotide kinase family protein [Candidatus Limnocylindrales bacterium]